MKPQVSTGAPPGTRTPNPRIKSPLLRNSIHLIYQHLYASTLARYPQWPEVQCRPPTGATARYRDIRASTEQTGNLHGLDHLREMRITTSSSGGGGGALSTTRL